MIKHLDDSVGAIMKSIEKEGLYENTIFIFYSDNGGVDNRYDNIPLIAERSLHNYPESHPLRFVATSNTPLRSGKGTLYEGGIRVPLIIRWPDKIKKKSKTEAIVSCVDFYPTFMDIAQGELPQNQIMDGISIYKIFTENIYDTEREVFTHYPVYHHEQPMSSLRKGDWKIIQNLVTSPFDVIVSWGHHSTIKQVVKSKMFYPIFVTGLSGNGKTLMIEQVHAELKKELIRVNITIETDEDDLLGGFRLVNGETKFVPGPVIEAMEKGEIDLWWVAATNPLVSMPDLNRVKAAIQNCSLVVLSEAYTNTETSHYAHLLLPAAQWSEKAGVMTNSERRITYCPAFRPCFGQSRPDWEIFAEVGQKLGFIDQFTYDSSSEVYSEFTALTSGRLCDSSGLNHELLKSIGPQQWPFPRESNPTKEAKRLYEDKRFATPNGRAQFYTKQPLGIAEPPCDMYPLVLTVGRYLGQWHTMTRTGKVNRLNKMHPEPLLEIHPMDAKEMNIKDGELSALNSRRGYLTVRVKETVRIRRGTVFLPMHWGFTQTNHCETNNLMHEQSCPISKQPELKASAVSYTHLDAADE